MATKTTYNVAVMTDMAPEVQAVIRDCFPEKFDLRFTKSNNEADLLQLAPDADFIIAGAGRITETVIAASPNVNLIHKYGIGVDKIDLDAARRANVRVVITGGANAIPVAEHTVMLMLAASRRLAYADRSVREGKWVKAQLRSVCFQLRDKTIGLYGFGNIGRMVATLLSGFGARIIYHDAVRAPDEVEAELGATYVPFDQLLARSDIVSLHAPATAQTEGRFDTAEFAAMKDGVIFVNTARGELIVEPALVGALLSGKVHAAGLDAFRDEPPKPDNPLFAMDQVVLTPHTGGGVFDNVANVGRHIVRNIENSLSGAEIAPRDIVV